MPFRLVGHISDPKVAELVKGGSSPAAPAPTAPQGMRKVGHISDPQFAALRAKIAPTYPQDASGAYHAEDAPTAPYQPLPANARFIDGQWRGFTDEQSRQIGLQEESQNALRSTPTTDWPTLRAFQNQVVAGGIDTAGLIGRVVPTFGESYIPGDSNHLHTIAGDLRASASEVYSPQSAFPNIANYGSQAAGTMAKVLPIAMATGPAGVIAEASATRASQAAQEADNAGLKGWDKAKYVGRATAIEGVTTAIFQGLNKYLPGLGGIENVGAQPVKASLAKMLGKGALSVVGELTEEETIGVLDSVNQAFSGVDPTATDPEKMWKQAKDTAWVTLATLGLANTVQGARLGIDAYVKRNPDKAKAIAELPENPSRKQIAEAAGFDADAPSTLAERESLRKQTKDRLAAVEVADESDLQRMAATMTEDEFVKAAPKPSRSSPETSFDSLASSLPQEHTGEYSGPEGGIQRAVMRPANGQPGIGFAYDAEAAKNNQSDAVVFYDDNGSPAGVLKVHLDANGNPELLSVAVKPEHQRKGIASKLFDEARKRYPNIDQASGAGGYTEEGARFAYRRLRNQAENLPTAQITEEQSTDQVNEAQPATEPVSAAQPQAQVPQAEQAATANAPQEPVSKMVEAGVKARYKNTSGVELGEFVEPSQEHAEAVDWLAARGKKVRFFKNNTPKTAPAFYDPATDTIYVHADRKGDALWYAVGHEYAHASGADERLADLPESLIEEAKAKYLKGAAAPYRATLLKNERMLRNEAVARYLGDFLADPERRARMQRHNPNLWEKIKAAIVKMIGPAQSKADQRVLEELAKVEPPSQTIKAEATGDGSSIPYAPSKRGKSPEVRAFEELNDAERIKQGRNDTQEERISAARQKAQQRVNENPQSVVDEIIAAGDAGKTIDADTTIAYGELLEQAHKRFVETGDVKEFQKAQELFYAYRSTGTAWSDQGAARRDELSEPERRRAIAIEAMMAEPQKYQKQLREAQEAVKNARNDLKKLGEEPPSDLQLSDNVKLSDSYSNAPAWALGIKKEGTQTEYDDQKYKYVQAVRVTFPDGSTHVDAVKGLNKPHALERARRNWNGAKIEPITKEQANTLEPGIKLSDSAESNEQPTNPKRVSPRKVAARKKLTEAQKALKSLQKRIASENVATMQKMKDRGHDVDKLSDVAADPIKFNRFVRDLGALKGGWSDVAYEYYRSWGLMSGPTTQFANIGASWVDMVHSMVKWTAEASLNTATRPLKGGKTRANEATFGELPHILAGLPGLFRKARLNAAFTFHNEMSGFKTQHGDETDLRDYAGGAATTGKIGKALRLWFRIASAADDFNKTLRGETMVGAYAYRLAKQEGLSGQELTNYIAKQTGNPTSEAWKMALEGAERGTLSDRGGKLSQTLEGAAGKLRQIPGFRYILPFVHTPLRALSRGLENSYLDTPGFLLQVAKNVKNGKDPLTDAGARAATQVVAWSIMAALWDGAGDSDDEEAWITGTDQKHPYSIKVGNKWISYARIDPIATVLGVSVDVIKQWKNGNKTGAAAQPFISVMQMTKEKSMLDGLGDVFRLLESMPAAYKDESADRVISEGSKMATNHLAGWVPNLLRSGVRATEQNKPQTRNWGQSAEPEQWMGRVKDRLLQRIELPSLVGATEDSPVIGLFGEKRKQTTFDERPVTDFAYRFLVPAKSEEVESSIHPGYKFIANWNQVAPLGEEIGDMELSPTFIRDKQKVSLTDKQYVQLGELAGKYTAAMWKVGKFNESKPTQAQADAFKAIVSEARQKAKEAILAKGGVVNPGIEPNASTLKLMRSERIQTLQRSIAGYGYNPKHKDAKARKIAELKFWVGK